MNHDSYSDEYVRDILTSVKTVAVVGASPRPQRPSHGVMRYLQGQGYRAIPVNPFAAGGLPPYAVSASGGYGGGYGGDRGNPLRRV